MLAIAVWPEPTGPPALAPAAAECTPKGWQAKKIPAFSLLGKVLTLTSEFVEYFTPFPKPKATPWEQQAPDFQNTQHCTDEPEVTGPDGGLNPNFWKHMTQHGHDHDAGCKYVASNSFAAGSTAQSSCWERHAF